LEVRHQRCTSHHIKRLYKRFDTFDLNNDDKMQLSELLVWADRMKYLCNSTPEQIERMRSAIRTFFEGHSVTDEGLPRDDWVESNRLFAQCEKERKKQGEPSLIALLGNAYFDVLDKNGDGTVNFDELEVMMKAFAVPPVAAHTFFEKADVNNDGFLQREEMHKVFELFWMEAYHPHYDGIYAYKY